MDLSEAYTDLLPSLEAEMRSLLEPPSPDLALHYGILHYHMGWVDAHLSPVDGSGGKRLRPLLCLLSCLAAGGDVTRALPAAAGLELLHNFSLIHDDIEDNGLARRHRPTAWTVFGLPLACNAGDAMFTLAHMAFYRLQEHGVPSDLTLQVLRCLDETCVGLTEGQYLDMSFENRLDVTVDEYFAMIHGKTAVLLGASAEIGALLAGAASPAVAAYRRFGRALGMAFQLQDDLLGIWGDEAVTGKSAAGDILRKKKSLPVVFAFADEDIGPDLQALYAGPAFLPGDVQTVLHLLDLAGARGYTDHSARDALAEARQALDAAAAGAPPIAQAPLHELIESLIDRRS